MKKFISCVLFFIIVFSGFAKEDPGIGIGANIAYPLIEKELKNINFISGELYTVTDADLEYLISKSADIQINIFELLDCMYRYLSKYNFRVKIQGDSLRNANKEYILDGRMVGRIIPFDKIAHIETGAVFKKEQNACDIFLTEKHTSDLEFGTGLYETHFGFKKIEPLNFDDCFGLKVKTRFLNITKEAKRVHLYDRGKGSFHVKGFFRGKHWYLDLIKKR